MVKVHWREQMLRLSSVLLGVTCGPVWCLEPTSKADDVLLL